MTSRNCTTCAKYTCDTLLHRTSSMNGEVVEWMKTIPKRNYFWSDIEHLTLTINCDSYIKRIGYHTRPVSDEEAEFPIAYNILIHKDIEQMESLLKVIYRPQNTYCIHVDRKSPNYLHNSVHSLAKCPDNVFVASKLCRAF